MKVGIQPLVAAADPGGGGRSCEADRQTAILLQVPQLFACDGCATDWRGLHSPKSAPPETGLSITARSSDRVVTKPSHSWHWSPPLRRWFAAACSAIVISNGGYAAEREAADLVGTTNRVLWSGKAGETLAMTPGAPKPRATTASRSGHQLWGRLSWRSVLGVATPSGARPRAER